MDQFSIALPKVLVHEGGYSNHPADPGGATMKGITQRVYDTDRASRNLAPQPVKNISDAEVASIYRKRYWDAIKGDKLPAGVSYAVFDGAVNSGVAQSVKWLQRALGINADGVIGPATLLAIEQTSDYDALIDKICDRRLAFLQALKTWSTFGKGWRARVNDVRATGKQMATGSNGAEAKTMFVSGGDAKAWLSDAKSAPSRAPGDTAAGAGGVSAIIAQTQEQLTPYVQIGFVAKAAAFLTIAGLIVAVAGLGYRWWAAKRKRELEDALDIGKPQT